jgi:hypothetical protein
MKKLILALTVSAAASSASATIWDLTDVRSFSDSGAGQLFGQIRVGGVAVDSVEFNDDNSDNDLVSAGDFSVLFHIGNFDANGNGLGAAMFTWSFSNLIVSNSGIFSGDFTCTEGTFSFTVGASLCGNYSFGPNYANESTINADGSNLMLGGDDSASGIPQSINSYAGMAPIGTTDFITTITFANGELFDLDKGSQFTWVAQSTPEVPVPAAAWLFGSALIGLAGIGRKRKIA